LRDRPYSLLVKPASADCNLHCAYCFYLDHKYLYPETKRHRMSDEVLQRMISSYMATDQPTYSFGWQGGEPTLMGLDFFRKVTDLQKKYGKRGAVVANGLQTNATLITDELASHFGQYRFLLGVSLDGPEEVHNSYRRSVDGKGSHERVLKGIDHLHRHGVEYNILTLVSTANVERPKEIYRYLVSRGENFHQYIPCVEFDDNGEPLPYTITGEQWGEFLWGIFSEWIKEDTLQVSVRHFDSILTLMVDGYPNLCSLDTNCCQYFVVEYNGDVYPCDFFVRRDLRLGSIMDSSWEQMLASPIYREFGARKSQWNKQCQACSYLTFCAGDCQKQRYYGSDNPRQLSWLCGGWKFFYERSLPQFSRLAQKIKRLRSRQSPVPTPVPVPPELPGRNDPCYCESGRKYKHCHGR
jgi:uncharacterized protein